jgi:hypothetical protein
MAHMRADRWSTDAGVNRPNLLVCGVCALLQTSELRLETLTRQNKKQSKQLEANSPRLRRDFRLVHRMYPGRSHTPQIPIPSAF